jgi:biopolymer transport protein ExbB
MKTVLFIILSLFPLQASLFANAPAPKSTQQTVDLKKVFTAAPFIYTLLSAMSIASMGIWIYSLATFRKKDTLPNDFQKNLERLLQTRQYDEAEKLCKRQENLLASLIQTGLSTRKLGPQIMMDAMKSEGKRVSTTIWQRLAILNDIVVIAPMLGLLGTVIGMFYAFYDVNRSVESINALFDGLGIAVGTTVMGLIVAIVAMIFYTTLKYRVVKTLSQVENEALQLSAYIDAK